MTSSTVARRRRQPRHVVHESSPLGRLCLLDYQATEGKGGTLNWHPMRTFSNRDLNHEEAGQMSLASARTELTRRQSRERTQANQRQDFLNSVCRISSVQLTVALVAVLLLLAFNLNIGQVVASSVRQTATGELSFSSVSRRV